MSEWNMARQGKILASKQEEYRAALKKELCRFPSIGVYQGETKEDWQKFVKYLEIVYNDVDGDRREIIDRVKLELSKKKDYFDDLLSDLGLNSTSSIRKITNKLKRYVPSPEYKKLQDAETNYSSAVLLMEKYKQGESDMKNKILAGMRKKYPEAECQRRFEEVIEKNKILAENGRQLVAELSQKVKENVQCQRYEIITRELKCYIDEWTTADSSVGKDNIIRGRSFEEKCEKEGISLILNKLGLKKGDVSIFTNVSWKDCPGEIDIVILDNSESKVLCLAECKSRLFDISQGYRQSGQTRSVEKTRLSIKQRVYEVSFDIPCFVLTVLPFNDYFLGVESKIKQDLNKYTLEYEFSEVDFDKVYDALIVKYDKLMSPVRWFEKYSETNLIILV